MKPPSKSVPNGKKKRDWRVLAQGAVGVELALCGFGFGKNLYHVYIHLGLVTIYLTSRRLDRVMALLKNILLEAKGRR